MPWSSCARACWSANNWHANIGCAIPVDSCLDFDERELRSLLTNGLFANRWIAPIAIAYLLGSIPFGYLLVRIFLKQDIRSTGSGNIGATNVARSGAKGLGIATLLLDLAKAYAGVMIARSIAIHSLGPDAPDVYDIEVAAAVAAICGHVFPVWLKFRGGKGVASALGVFLALSWQSAVAALLVFVLIFAVTRYVSLASVVGSATFPLIGFHFVAQRSPIIWFGYLFIPALIIVKHHGNIRRLLNGTESRFGSKNKSHADEEGDPSPDSAARKADA
jgi:acyl phosphate:glycerol-3-phosphate acyltransferase